MKRAISMVAALVLFLGGVEQAEASFIININQVGADVVATGMGTINTAALTSIGTSNASDEPFIDPQIATIVMGGTAGVSTLELIYQGISGPASWGAGGFLTPSSATGDHFGLDGNNGRLVTPQGYISGTELMGTDTFSATTISNLGLNPGTYTYTWGSGSTADSLTVNVGPVAVPEPSSLTLLGIGVIGLAGYRRRWRRQIAQACPHGA